MSALPILAVEATTPDRSWGLSPPPLDSTRRGAPTLGALTLWGAMGGADSKSGLVVTAGAVRQR